MPISLAATALDRVAQVLPIRDELLVAHQREVSDDTAFDIRRHLDTLLWCWSAAFDAVARVAHLVYALPANKLSTASWRKASWVNQLGDDRLASLVATGTVGRAVLDISFPLRHTIHGEGLSAQTYMIDRGYATLTSSASANKRWDVVPEALQVAADHVHVPRAVYSTELAAPIAALGGGARWGVDAESDTHVSIEPATFCERLMPHALATLNTLMATIAVERLAGVSETKLDADPPVGVPALQADQGARWNALLGLTTLGESACRATATD